jgi:hypothetical protein
MSTNNKLTAEQTAAYNFAVDMYVIRNAKKHGGIKAKPVIIIPRFEEDTDGQWVPIEDNGTRVTAKEGLLYLRLGMPVLRGLETKVEKHNEFIEEKKLLLTMELLDLTIGSSLPEQVLVTQETLETPEVNAAGQFKGGWQIKYAGANSNVQCTFTGTREKVDMETGEVLTVTYLNAPIYRRVKLAPAGSTNTLIAHTNGADISKFASAAWAKLNNPAAGIPNLKGGASEITSTEARLKELKAIKAALRTPEQKAEIAELTEALEELTSK